MCSLYDVNLIDVTIILVESKNFIILLLFLLWSKKSELEE